MARVLMEDVDPSEIDWFEIGRKASKSEGSRKTIRHNRPQNREKIQQNTYLWKVSIDIIKDMKWCLFA